MTEIRPEDVKPTCDCPSWPCGHTAHDLRNAREAANAEKQALLVRLALLVLLRGTRVCPHDQGLLLIAPHGMCALCGLDGRSIKQMLKDEKYPKVRP